MTDDVGMEPIGVIVARMIDKLARPGSTPAGAHRDRPKVGASGAFPDAYPASPVAMQAGSGVLMRGLLPRVSFHAARHSAEAELNGLAVASGEESDTTAAAPARGSRAHHDGPGAAVVVKFEKRGGDRSRPQWVLQGGEQTVTRDVTRQTVPLRYRR